MKQNKYLLKKRQERIRTNLHKAIIARDPVRVHAISVMLGLNFSDRQIQDLFNKKHD